MFGWSIKTEEEANALLPENNLKDGIYSGVVTRQEIVYPKNLNDDGSSKNPFLKLNIQLDVTGGKVFADACIFDSARMFFVRKHFWESAGCPEMIDAAPHEYLNRRVTAKCKVETYYSEKYAETKNKLVVVDFVQESEKTESQSSNETFPDDEISF